MKSWHANEHSQQETRPAKSDAARFNLNAHLEKPALKPVFLLAQRDYGTSQIDNRLPPRQRMFVISTAKERPIARWLGQDLSKTVTRSHQV